MASVDFTAAADSAFETTPETALLVLKRDPRPLIEHLEKTYGFQVEKKFFRSFSGENFQTKYHATLLQLPKGWTKAEDQEGTTLFNAEKKSVMTFDHNVAAPSRAPCEGVRVRSRFTVDGHPESYSQRTGYYNCHFSDRKTGDKYDFKTYAHCSKYSSDAGHFSDLDSAMDSWNDMVTEKLLAGAPVDQDETIAALKLWESDVTLSTQDIEEFSRTAYDRWLDKFEKSRAAAKASGPKLNP